MTPAVLLPDTGQLKDLSMSWPRQIAHQVGGRNERAALGSSSMPLIYGYCDPLIHQLQRWRKAALEITQEPTLVRFDHQQVVTSCRQHLLTEMLLAVESIAREHPSVPVQPADQDGGDGQFCFGFVGAPVNRFLGEDHP